METSKSFITQSVFVGYIFIIAVMLICLSGCALTGDPIYDPATGEYIASPLTSALSTLGEGVVDVVPDIVANGFGPQTIASLLSLVAGAGAVGYAAHQRRKRIKVEIASDRGLSVAKAPYDNS